MCNQSSHYMQSRKQGSFKHKQVLQRLIYSEVSSFVTIFICDPNDVDLLVTASDNLRIMSVRGAGLKNICFWKEYFEMQPGIYKEIQLIIIIRNTIWHLLIQWSKNKT